jgi:ABC-type dipeptide/oligopeptide/nickel transport system ATPase subunit
MWQERGLTMVVVTHDSTIARRAQRIGVMKNGRLNFKQPARAQSARAQLAQAQLAQAQPARAQSSGLQPPDLPVADEPPAG